MRLGIAWVNTKGIYLYTIEKLQCSYFDKEFNFLERPPSIHNALFTYYLLLTSGLTPTRLEPTSSGYGHCCQPYLFPVSFLHFCKIDPLSYYCF